MWPFAAQRTRGNASLSVEIHSDESIIEWLDDYSKTEILPLKGQISESNHSERQQFPSDPGMTLFEEQPNEEFYWKAVRGEVTFYEVGTNGEEKVVLVQQLLVHGEQEHQLGKVLRRVNERFVSQDALELVDNLEGTFLCRDPRTNRGLISPRGPCPVMFGVRATSKSIADKATEILVQNSGPTLGSRVFKTNQATGDHIESTHNSIIETKEILRGGHVVLNENIIAFSDSGDLNTLAQWLEVGDSIEWMGLEHENQFHLEALNITNSTHRCRPLCECGTRMKSMGSGQGVRCPKCKRKSDEK